MHDDKVWALEDLRNLFGDKHLFTIIVRFHERSRVGYINRQIKRQVEAVSMVDACAKALSEFSNKEDVRIGGIALPKAVKTGSKRPPNPFVAAAKKKRSPFLLYNQNRPASPFLQS